MKNSNAPLNILILLGLAAFAQVCAQPAGVTLTINGKQLDIAVPSTHESNEFNSNAMRHLVSSAIRRELLQRKVSEAKISVPKNLLSNAVDLYFSVAKISPAVADDVRQKGKTIVAALRAVVLQHEDAEDVYNRKLKDVISRKDWQVWVANHNTIEKILKLERAIPESLADMKAKSQEGLRSEIEMWLLFYRLTESFRISDGELLAKYREMYPTVAPSLEEITNEIRCKVLAQIQHEHLSRWWKTELDKLEIQIPPGYEGALEDAGVLPSPRLPQEVVDFLRNRLVPPSKEVKE